MESQILVGWREIAAYLRVSDDTAQRWNRRYSLPVCRSVGRRVRTSTALIDRWIEFMDQQARVSQAKSPEAAMKAAGLAP